MEGSWTFGFDQFGYLARRANELLGLLLPQGRHAAPGGSRSCARPIFRAPPFVPGCDPRCSPVRPKLTRAFNSSCIASRGARRRLFQAKGSFPVPVPPGSAPPQKTERGWSIPKSSPGALELRGGHHRAPARHRRPTAGALPAILQSPRSLNRPRERENWKKLLVSAE